MKLSIPGHSVYLFRATKSDFRNFDTIKDGHHIHVFHKKNLLPQVLLELSEIIPIDKSHFNRRALWGRIFEFLFIFKMAAT